MQLTDSIYRECKFYFKRKVGIQQKRVEGSEKSNYRVQRDGQHNYTKITCGRVEPYDDVVKKWNRVQCRFIIMFSWCPHTSVFSISHTSQTCNVRFNNSGSPAQWATIKYLAAVRICQIRHFAVNVHFNLYEKMFKLPWKLNFKKLKSPSGSESVCTCVLIGTSSLIVNSIIMFCHRITPTKMSSTCPAFFILSIEININDQPYFCATSKKTNAEELQFFFICFRNDLRDCCLSASLPTFFVTVLVKLYILDVLSCLLSMEVVTRRNSVNISNKC